MPNLVDRHYAQAPIIEAAVGFRVAALPTDRLQGLRAFVDRLARDYPDSRHLMPSGASLPPEAQAEPSGFVLSTKDGKQIIQAQRQSFRFSRLAPYDRWSSFIAEARRVWDLFCDAVGEVTPERFFVRYINGLAIPLDVALHEYFNIYPAVPDKGTLFNNMALMVAFNVGPPPAQLTTYLTPLNRVDIDGVPGVRISLDNRLDFAIGDQQMIWSNLDMIHELKNRVFEEQITDKMRERIQ